MDEPAEIVEARALVRTRTVVATGVGLVACALGLALLTLEVPDYALGFLVAAFFTSSLGVAFHRPWRDAERRLEAWTARREAPPTAEPSPATPDDPR
ncbi:MAG: hypothetical protein ABMB14_26670, partial [Myxococcota bacterium]